MLRESTECSSRRRVLNSQPATSLNCPQDSVRQCVPKFSLVATLLRHPCADEGRQAQNIFEGRAAQAFVVHDSDMPVCPLLAKFVSPARSPKTDANAGHQLTPSPRQRRPQARATRHAPTRPVLGLGPARVDGAAVSRDYRCYLPRVRRVLRRARSATELLRPER
jgi:hypothetical protein